MSVYRRARVVDGAIEPRSVDTAPTDAFSPIVSWRATSDGKHGLMVLFASLALAMIVACIWVTEARR